MNSKKEERKLKIKESARVLFIGGSIEQTTFKEIAVKAGVGEATVYRHYANKSMVAMDIALDYVTQYSSELIRILNPYKGTHLEKFEVVLDYYIRLFNEKPDYYIFLEHFDNFVSKAEAKPEGFELYEEKFREITRFVCDLANGETIDNSVKEDIDIDLLTYTFNITFVSLCQKLLIRGRITKEDRSHNHDEELHVMKDIMINSIKRSS